MKKWIYFFENSSSWHFLEILTNYFSLKIGRNISDKSRIGIELLEFAYKSKCAFKLKKEILKIEIKVNNQLRNCSLRWGSSDVLVFKQILVNEELKPVINRFEKLRKEPRAIIDAGANIGLTTLYLSSYFPNAIIICIEPNFENSELLKKNLMAVNYKLLRKGLWSKSVYLKEKVVDDAWGIQVGESNNEIEAKIESITLSEILDSFDLQRIDYLKMDIEGAEENIFYEDPQLPVVLDKVDCISIEPHSTVFENFLSDYLCNQGFEAVKSGELVIGFKN